jgi:hypothetical protein
MPPPAGSVRRASSASASFSNKPHMRSIFNRKSRNRFQELGGARFQRASFRILRNDQMLAQRGSLPTCFLHSSGRAAALLFSRSLVQDAQGCTRDACAPPLPPQFYFCGFCLPLCG